MRKLLSTAIAIGILATTSVAPAFAISVDAIPKFDSDNPLNNNVTVTTPGNGIDMNVQVNGGKGSVGTAYWDSFNVGKNSHVNFEFTDHNQTSLNRVNQAGGLSEIYGKITNSGCDGCGYANTGKVILLNPNGVLFGNGANVNLNSFTVSTLDGTYETLKKGDGTLNGGQLKLHKGDAATGKKITVAEGANIYGDKGVTFAADNVEIYNGSKIKTNITNNVDDTAYGKIKIVTADGVNFAYYNNGAVKNISDTVASNDKMMVSVNGYLESGNIDIRNYSNAADAAINLNGAALKAVKAQKGNDGNIWLTANNKIITDNSTLTTVNGGNVAISAGNTVAMKTSKVDSSNNIDISADKNNATVDSTILQAKNNVNIKAGKIASVQNGTTITGKKIKAEANDFWGSNASLDADTIEITAANDVDTKNVDFKNKKTTITAGQDVILDSVKGVGERNNGLTATAGRDMRITTDEALSVSSLIAKRDMSLKANSILSGAPKTQKGLREDGDSPERAYIEVGRTFTSEPNFEVTDSYEFTADRQFQKRHWIQYNDGAEKILLVNNRPYVPQQEPVEPSVSPSVDEEQAQMLNKIPRQPETYSNVANINNGRTTFVDVFAAASQIEIVDDEEEE